MRPIAYLRVALLCTLGVGLLCALGTTYAASASTKFLPVVDDSTAGNSQLSPRRLGDFEEDSEAGANSVAIAAKQSRSCRAVEVGSSQIDTCLSSVLDGVAPSHLPAPGEDLMKIRAAHGWEIGPNVHGRPPGGSCQELGLPFDT